MVICPIARAVHCTGCPFFKFCPAKTILGDYNKDAAEATKKTERAEPDSGEKTDDSAKS